MFVEDSGGGNLQETYDSGTVAIVQTIVLGSGGRLGIAIRDNAVPIVGTLFEVTNNGDTATYLGVDTTQVVTTVPVRIQFSDATTTGTLDEITTQRDSSGSAAIGFGVSVLARLKDDTNLVDASRIATVWNTVTTATSDADITFQLRTAGAALAERYRFNSSAMSVTTVSGAFTVKTLTNDSGVIVQGNLTAANAGTDVIANSTTARTAGTIFRTQRSSANVGIDVAFWGGTNVFRTNTTTTAAQAYALKVTFGTGPLISDNAEAVFMDLIGSSGAGADIQMGLTATLATQRIWRIGCPNLKVGITARTITDCVGYQFDNYGIGTNLTVTNYFHTRAGTSVTIGPSGTTTTYSVYGLAVHTITYTNTTGSTAACGVAGLRLDQITVAQNTGAGTLTVTNGATLYIVGAPLDGTGSTVTNKYAIFVDAGVARFDGDGTNVFEIDADTTVPGAATGRIPFKDTSTGVTRFIMVSDT